MTLDPKRQHHVRKGKETYRKADKDLFIFAYHAAKIVGKYERGATLGMASDMNVSPDTIENYAHGYEMFRELCLYDGGKFGRFVRQARRAEFIYFSHFRALYDAKKEYNLDTKQLLDTLMDIVQAEGDISSRAVEVHVRTRFGDTRDWTYYAAKAMKPISELLQQPDLPREIRKQLKETYSILGDKG